MSLVNPNKLLLCHGPAKVIVTGLRCGKHEPITFRLWKQRAALLVGLERRRIEWQVYRVRLVVSHEEEGVSCVSEACAQIDA